MVKIRFLGISAFEVVTASGVRIFIDLCLNRNPLSPLKAEEIDAADLILVSHGAWDHVGESVEIARRTGAVFMSGHDVRALADREGLPKAQILGTQPGATREVKGVRVRATVAHHASFISPEKDVYMSSPPSASSSTRRMAFESIIRATPACSGTSASSPSFAIPRW